MIHQRFPKAEVFQKNENLNKIFSIIQNPSFFLFLFSTFRFYYFPLNFLSLVEFFTTQLLLNIAVFSLLSTIIHHISFLIFSPTFLIFTFENSFPGEGVRGNIICESNNKINKYLSNPILKSKTNNRVSPFLLLAKQYLMGTRGILDVTTFIFCHTYQ